MSDLPPEVLEELRRKWRSAVFAYMIGLGIIAALFILFVLTEVL